MFQVGSVRPEEFLKMAQVEDEMWYYRSAHRQIGSCLDRKLGTGPARILDAGCGSGGLVRRLSAWRPEWSFTGLDRSPVACRLAKERAPGEWIEGDVERLPFLDCSFAAIVSVDVLYMVEDPRAALAEFFRCLRPGGSLVLIVPAYQWLWSYHDEAVHSKRRFTRGELSRLLEGAGFEMEYATYLNMFPFPLVVLRRKLFPPSAATSDVRLYPRPMEFCVSFFARIENLLLKLGIPMPFGSSVLAMARRPP